MKRIRVLIADDHALVRMGLRSLLGTQADITIVGEADDGDVAVRETLRLKPDVVLMDYMMPVKDGAAAAREILAAYPAARILILTSFGAEQNVKTARQVGIKGILVKSDDNDDIVSAIRKIAAGGEMFSEALDTSDETDIPASILTDRQQTVLALIVRGFANRDIAEHLGIREDTVKKLSKTIYERIGAANRAEAVAIALRKHLLKI